MAKKIARKCGTCRYLKRPVDGKPFHHSKAYLCSWTMPTSYVFPDSVRDHSTSSLLLRLRNEGTYRYMEPGEGKDCLCYEQAGRPTDDEDAKR